jgi:TonB family protein
MFTKLCLSTVLLAAACATTGTTMETREPAPHAKVQLDFTAQAAEVALFPAAKAPRLPSVDRIAHQVRARLGDEAVASIELCVAPDGKVTKVSMIEGTSYAPFDAAILRDAEQWQFASMPGATAATKLQTCERAKVRYLTPQ